MAKSASNILAGKMTFIRYATCGNVKAGLFF